MKFNSPLLVLNLLLISSAPRSAVADILEHWTTTQVTTNSLGGFGYLFYATNGCFVASVSYGDYGGFYSSVDGLNWTFRYLGTSSWDLRVSYSQGHIVSVGPWHEVLRSTDGTNWSNSYLPSSYYYQDQAGSITYGKGAYVWVGQTNGVGTILASTDAVNWSAPVINPGAGGPIDRVLFAGTRFVAVGSDGYVYFSTRGTNVWFRNAAPPTNYFSYANGVFFMGGIAGTNLLSTDALNWTPVSTGLSVPILGVGQPVKGVYIALADVGLWTSTYKVATSTDGTNWFLYGPPLPPGSGLATDGTRFLGVNSTPGIGFYRYTNFVIVSDPLVAVCMTNANPPKVALSGLVGWKYQIQSTDSLKSNSNNWITNATIQLTNTPFIWTDLTATNAQRFYRAVLLP